MIDLKKMFGRRADVVGIDVIKLQVDIAKKKLKSKEARGNKKSKVADEAGKNKKKAKKHKSRIGRPNARKRVKR